MGTSLKVQPFASLPKLLKPSCAVLVINREFPQSLRSKTQLHLLVLWSARLQIDGKVSVRLDSHEGFGNIYILYIPLYFLSFLSLTFLATPKPQRLSAHGRRVWIKISATGRLQAFQDSIQPEPFWNYPIDPQHWQHSLHVGVSGVYPFPFRCPFKLSFWVSFGYPFGFPVGFFIQPTKR